MRRLRCWFVGHIYVVVTDWASDVLGLTYTDRVICLRCLRGGLINPENGDVVQ